VTLVEKLQKIDRVKFSLGKSNEYHKAFSKFIGAYSMYENGFGLGISSILSPEYQIRGIFNSMPENGIFVFNINGVDIIKASVGFRDFNEASENEMITEWELSMILKNYDYLCRTIFHNGKVEFKQLRKSLIISWK
jgi:hypothetical protein